MKIGFANLEKNEKNKKNLAGITLILYFLDFK